MATAVAHQPSLLGDGTPSADGAALARVRRIALDDDAWVEHLPGWVNGHEALLDELARTTAWRRERRMMYDRMVDVPRLVAALPEDGPGHPVLEQIRALLDARYDTRFVNTFMLGWGDLIVMGGSCQRTWEHGVPKVAHAWLRMAVMFRPEWKKS